MSNDTHPQFSVVIPTYDRPEALRCCLEALASLERPSGGFEVVVVDDGGRTEAAATVQRFALRLDIRTLRIANGGPGAARNAGAHEARGRLLAFTDDDCSPETCWLTALEAAADKHPETLLGGRTVNALSTNCWAQASQVVTEAAYAYKNASGSNALFFASNNIAVPTRGFLELGGFDESYRVASEDRELCDRWTASGRLMAYVDDAIIRHAHDLTAATFARQQFSYGRGAALYHRTRKQRGSGSSGDLARNHLAFLARFREPLARVPWPRRALVLAALTLWQPAYFGGYLFERILRRTRI